MASNIEAEDADSFIISYYLSDDGSSLGQLLDEVSVSKLPSSHFKQFSFKFQSSNSLFGKSIIALINSGNSVIESDYSNNEVPVLISSTNIPFASAGPGRTISAGQTVYLDGSKSIDPGGRPLSFEWSFSSLPTGSQASLSQPHSIMPTLTTDLPGTYVIQLVVNNGVYSSAPTAVTIGTENTPPVADAGPDQTVLPGHTVTLNGSKSSDANGDRLTYQWTFVSMPQGSSAAFADSTAVTPTFELDLPGTYMAQLIVSDGMFFSTPAIVTVSTENTPPAANAGPAQAVQVGQTVILDGSQSNDADNNTLTYHWSLLSLPPGSQAILSNIHLTRPTFTADVQGIYLAQLYVNDGRVDSFPDTVIISTNEIRPVADAGEAQMVCPAEDMVSLNGSNSYDADSDPLTFKWSILYAPTGSTAVLSDITAASPTITLDLPGEYVVQLIVSDGTLSSTPDTVLITVQTIVPNVVAGSAAQADSAISTAYLVVGETSQQYSNTVPAGLVVSQNPPGGTCVARGIPVNIIVSLGPPPVTVPNVVGAAQDSAVSALKSAGLTLGIVTTQHNTTIPSGYVISENPPAGTSIPQGSSVDLVVSLGPPMVSVPDVTGKSQSDARAALTSAGLTAGTVTTQSSTIIPAGDVISESPAAGTFVQQGSPVNLVVSLGSPLPPEPTTVASVVDPTVATTIGSATAFLYTGSNPIQTGVATGAIQPQYAAVIRGKVMAKDGSALSGVMISILNHPEFGQTLSRADGVFDIAVNGGGLLTVDYLKSGYLPVQRQVDVPWQDYALLPNVVMIQLDTQVSPIDLTAATPIQVAQSSTVTDGDGTRKATILIPQGTTASIVLPDGTTQSISSLHIRATEYTVGTSGPNAMPAALPPTSGYTYCVELTADEALAAGAKTVTFNSPVYHYVENFLDFPEGSAVPAGYYDRTNGQWIASKNGLVIKILSIGGDMADLDIDGSNQAADSVSLAALGITDAERMQLASLYSVGQSLWRVPIPHFSPWDFNWPFAPAPGAHGPNQPTPKSSNSPDKPCESSGSIIGCESQTLGEEVAIAGTGMKLHYQNDREAGHIIDRTSEISLTGENIPASLKRVELTVTVAGRSFTSSYPASANQKTLFTWDGLDAYNRMMQGGQPVTMSIGYVYSGVYLTPSEKPGSGYDRLFGHFSYYGTPVTGDFARQEVTLWQNLKSTIGLWNAQAVGLGGWTLDVHHFYDVGAKKLYLGDGSQRSAQGMNMGIISTLAGNGLVGYSGDGGPAAQAAFQWPTGVAVGPDGSVYIDDTGNSRIRKVGSDGIISTVAGNGSSGFGGDGGPATLAKFNWAQGITVGSDGSIYIADTRNNRIRKVGTDGIITTVAGNGTNGFSGDGGPAVQAGLSQPWSVAVGSDGSIHIADNGNNRIRKVASDGNISTVAGNGTRGYSGDGSPAAQAALNGPTGVAVGPDGSVYVADMSNRCVRKIGSDGIISTVVGNGSYGFAGDGGLATQAQLTEISGIAVASDGSIYIADTRNNRIRKVGPDGVITTVAGNGNGGYSGDGGPATRAEINFPLRVAAGPDGRVYDVDNWNNRVRCISPPLPGFSSGDILIPSEDGSAIYRFDSTGKHLSTIQPLTGAILYEFGYDDSGRLATVTDGNGNTLTIDHDGNGNPMAVVSPFGQRTTLAVDINGYLSKIIDPAGGAYKFSYTSDGLMTSMINPNDNTYNFAYDSYGRLVQDSDPAGGSKTLLRADNPSGYSVAVTTGLNRTTNYSVHHLSTGGTARVTVAPDGSKTEIVSGTNGSQNGAYPDGTKTNLLQGPDPRFGMLIPLPTITTTTPGGLSLKTAMSCTTTLSNPGNPFSLTSQTDTLSINGRKWLSTFNSSTNTFTATSPVGRQETSTIDSLGKLVSRQVSGLAPASFSYDSNGRLSTIWAGTGSDTRTTSFGYDTNGFLASITDPSGRSLGLLNDSAGRVTSVTNPDGTVTGFEYDRNGNLTSITPPDRPPHIFLYSSVDQNSSYLTPLSGSYTYTYNIDRELTNIYFPSGKEIVNTYSNALLTSIVTPEGEIDLTYLAGQRLGSVAKGTEHITYGYDGSLLTSEQLTGTLTQSLEFTYDNNFRVNSFTYAGASVAFTYDNDGLLTKSGSFTVGRNVGNGLPVTVGDGALTLTRGFNMFGEIESENYAVGTVALPSYSLTRDNAGRIVSKSEKLGSAITSDYAYTYDGLGRLLTVTKDGTLVETYTYDPHGTRTSESNALRSISRQLTYDAEDHILTAGDTTYEYDLDGFLTTKTRGSEITRYTYSLRGELSSVTLPDGRLIEYAHDPLGRRIAKKINGTITEKYLWQGMTRLLAVYDGSDNLIQRFQYADSRMPVAMTQSGSTYYLAYDPVGTAKLIADSTGTVVKCLNYDSFGNLLSDSNPSFKIPLGFAGGLYDPDTGLVRFGYRDYDPDTGRWTAKDPIMFNGKDTNLYGYCLNNPVNLIDPQGLIIGSILSKVGTIFGQTAQEAGLSGKIVDSLIAAVLVFDNGTIVPKTNNQYIQGALIALESRGAMQTLSLASLSIASAPAWVPVVLVGGAGLEIGAIINDVYQGISGAPLGADVYDWFHTEQRQKSACN